MESRLLTGAPRALGAQRWSGQSQPKGENHRVCSIGVAKLMANLGKVLPGNLTEEKERGFKFQSVVDKKLHHHYPDT